MTAPIATEPREPRYEHLLTPELLRRPVHVAVVGCGGTGSTLASGLAHLHQSLLVFGHPRGLKVTLIDGDRIAFNNCVRQPFSASEVGLYKTDVLATRINLFHGLHWRSVPRFVDQDFGEYVNCDLLISCVDSRKARKAITRSVLYYRCFYWLDLGNNSDTGQFVLGQPVREDRRCALRLPTVAELYPEILDPKLDDKDALPSCSAEEALESQSPFINQTLANQALAMLARFFRYGLLTYHGAFVNLVAGTVSPLPVNPEVWKSVTGGRLDPEVHHA